MPSLGRSAEKQFAVNSHDATDLESAQSADHDEIESIATLLDALLTRIDLLGYRAAGNHISHGLELLRAQIGR